MAAIYAILVMIAIQDGRQNVQNEKLSKLNDMVFVSVLNGGVMAAILVISGNGCSKTYL